MKVEIINPEVLENLERNHGEFARVCYDTPAERAEAFASFTGELWRGIRHAWPP